MKAMKLQVVDMDGERVRVEEAYEVRIPGWTEERYFAEAPEEGLSDCVAASGVTSCPRSPVHNRSLPGARASSIRNGPTRVLVSAVITAPVPKASPMSSTRLRT